MKNLVFVALLAMGGLAISTDALAEKIGFVNTERLLREAPLSIKAQKRLEKEFSGRDLELQKMTKQARDIQAQLDKDGMTMSDADRKAKERDLSVLSQTLQRQSREFREDLNQRRNEELGQIQDKARRAIQDIARTEKFDLIVEQAVYFNPKIDITDRVMKELGDK
ncbi:MAG: OmpH family outer membrane protein [Thiobacillaceae bacterium]